MSALDVTKQPRVLGGDPSSKGGQWKESARPGGGVGGLDGEPVSDRTRSLTNDDPARGEHGRQQFSLRLADGSTIVAPGDGPADAYREWLRLEARRAEHAGVDTPDWGRPEFTGTGIGSILVHVTDHDGVRSLIAQMNTVRGARPLYSDSDGSCTDCRAAFDEPHALDCVVVEEDTGYRDVPDRVEALGGLARNEKVPSRLALVAGDLSAGRLQHAAAAAARGNFYDREDVTVEQVWVGLDHHMAYEQSQILDRNRVEMLVPRAERSLALARIVLDQARGDFGADEEWNGDVHPATARALEAAAYAEAAATSRLRLAQEDRDYLRGFPVDDDVKRRVLDSRYRGQILSDPGMNEVGGYDRAREEAGA